MITFVVLVFAFCGVWDLWEFQDESRSKPERIKRCVKGICYLAVATLLVALHLYRAYSDAWESRP